MELEKTTRLYETSDIDEVNSYLRNGDWFLVSAYPKKIDDDFNFKMFYVLGYMSSYRNREITGDEKTKALLSSLSAGEITPEEEARKKELLSRIRNRKK